MSSLEKSEEKQIQVEELWSRVIGSESLLASWIASSLLLLGNALLFFHMVSASKSVEVSRPLAGIIATGFVILSVMVLLVSTRSYRTRSKEAVGKLPTSLKPFERSVKGWNNTMSGMLCALFVFVGFVIVYDSMSTFMQDGF